MEFIDFKYRNVLIAEHQDEYITLPAHQVKDPQGTTFFKMSLTDEEVDFIVKNRCLYGSALTFGKPFTPMQVYASIPFPYLQPITPQISAIYYHDTDSVFAYNTDGQIILRVGNTGFDKWVELAGFENFKYVRVVKKPASGIILPDGIQDIKFNVFFQFTNDKKAGGSKKLNPQYFKQQEFEK